MACNNHPPMCPSELLDGMGAAGARSDIPMEVQGATLAHTRHSTVDSQIPDWDRERLRPGEWNPGKSLILCIREYQRIKLEKPMLHTLRSKWAVFRHRFWSAVSGADIPLQCHLGGGLSIPHPNGVVIHPAARIGPNCLIFQQVTIGSLMSDAAPLIGGHVDIGAGAKVLGGIVIGDHAQIGANAVVLSNVPPGCTAVGIPARCLQTH